MLATLEQTLPDRHLQQWRLDLSLANSSYHQELPDLNLRQVTRKLASPCKPLMLLDQPNVLLQHPMASRGPSV